MTADSRPLLAITMGDPAGVGAEVVISALAARRARAACRALIIGDSRVLARALAVLGRRLPVRVVASASEAERRAPRLCLLDLKNADPDSIPVGRVSAAAGRAAADYIALAAALARTGEVAGMVTAPINKEALRLAGLPHPGHTEMLAALCGVTEVAMMLVHREARVSHVTTHVALREACDLVTRSRVLSVIRLTDRALQRMGLPRRRIGVSGLNPHASESGLFGHEEANEISPAIAEATEQGIDAVGPLPPDTAFPRHRAGEFDALVAMTHDQGHIAVKAVAFAPGPGGRLRSAGVNLTLGLPIIRTSVDHGTAFDIAGKGLADSASMVEAICLAARMATPPAG